MKNTLKTKIAIVTACMLLSFSNPAAAQVETEFFKGGVNDGMKLMEAYISPFTNAFGAAFNSAWYNTAKTHKFGGFDITLSVSAGFVPDEATEFDIAGIDFTNIELVDPGANTIAPTIAGSKEPGPELHVMASLPSSPGSEVELANFNSPQGTAYRTVPAPMLQAGIGLPLGSEIKLRYIPNTPVDEGSVRLLGAGLSHSISQYFNLFKMLPVNISAFGAYNKLSVNVPISVKPVSLDHYDEFSFSDFTNQAFLVDIQAWNASLIGSVDFSVLTGYAGIGYSKTSTLMNIEGNIPLPVIDPAISETSPVYTDAGVIEDIEQAETENYSGIRLNVGGRVKLGVFTFHVDYTYADYNVLSSGIGISFR